MQIAPITPTSLSPLERALRGWVEDYLNLEKVPKTVYCDTRPVVVGGKKSYLTPRQLDFLIQKRETDGDEAYRDGREDNLGGQSTLTEDMKKFLVRRYVLNWGSTIVDHHEQLVAQGLAKLGLNPEDPESHVPSYFAVRRFLNNLPRYIQLFAQYGRRKAREMCCGCPLPLVFKPGELYVSDTLTFTKIKLWHNGELKPLQLTFVMDAGSRYVLGFVLHFDDATRAKFIELLQKCFLHKKQMVEGLEYFLLPVAILTDNGPLFKNASVMAACGDLAVKKLFSQVHCPMQNGRAERGVRTIKEKMTTPLVELHKYFTKRLHDQILESCAGLRPDKNYVRDALLGAFQQKLRILFQEYNNRPRRVLEGKSAKACFDDFVAEDRQRLRTRQQIVDATMVLVDQKPGRGRFDYNNKTYYCPEIVHLSGKKVQIRVNPCEANPLEVEVYYRKELVGIASRVPKPSPNLKNCGVNLPALSAEDGLQLEAVLKDFEIDDIAGDFDPKRPLAKGKPKPKPVGDVAVQEDSSPPNQSIVIDAEPIQFQILDHLLKGGA